MAYGLGNVKMSDEKLWCVRISDSVVPAESELAALRWANEYNKKHNLSKACLGKFNTLPVAIANVWPDSKEEHERTFRHTGIYLVGDTAYYNSAIAHKHG